MRAMITRWIREGKTVAVGRLRRIRPFGQTFTRRLLATRNSPSNSFPTRPVTPSCARSPAWLSWLAATTRACGAVRAGEPSRARRRLRRSERAAGWLSSGNRAAPPCRISPAVAQILHMDSGGRDVNPAGVVLHFRPPPGPCAFAVPADEISAPG